MSMIEDVKKDVVRDLRLRHVERALRDTFEASLASFLSGLEAYGALGQRAAGVSVRLEFHLDERPHSTIMVHTGKRVFK